jgi:hypothetical protein
VKTIERDAIAEKGAVREWRSLPDKGIRAAASKVALEVAGRLHQPEHVEAAVLEAKLQSEKGVPQWGAHSLAQGYAGLALLFEQLDRCYPNDGWGTTAHQYLEIAAHGVATSAPLTSSLFAGLGGVAFSAWYLSRQGTRYQRLLATLDRSLISIVKRILADLHGRWNGVGSEAFDVISGLSGAGVYLLARGESAEAQEVLVDLVGVLIELSEESDGLPNWHTPAYLSSPQDFMLKLFPSGYLNCGLAHGIPGPLAILSLARMAEVSCKGIDEAMERLAGWLANHRLDDEWGINWPAGVGLLAEGGGADRIAATHASPTAQAGWCYGSPGVARSLYLAGIALQKPAYCDLAIRSIEDVLRRPLEARKIRSPTFCHGVAGLLQIVMRFANDTASPSIRAGSTALTTQLLKLYEPQSLLGFRSLGPDGNLVDQPGLLDGAPGVALVLLAAAAGDVEPGWDRMFLLS